MISIITFTLGRPKYIIDLTNSIINTDLNVDEPPEDYGCWDYDVSRLEVDFEHLIFYQGVSPSKEESKYLKHIKNVYKYPHKIIQLDKNYGPGIGCNLAKEHINKDSKLVMKADDDCLIRSPYFLQNVNEIFNIIPQSVFSPFPVGLINNLGGPPAISNRFVKYSKNLDTYYTFRPVNHVGGFARICPTDLFMDCVWPEENLVGTSGNEDGYFSNFCKSKNVPMYYLENALIVEHNESTLGQHERYKEYFKDGRF